MATRPNRISGEWIRSCRKTFREFLRETGFPDIERHGERGPSFTFPEWLVMFIAVIGVKSKIKSYIGLHRFICEHWDDIGWDEGCRMISESQLRERLKKIKYAPGTPPGFVFQIFPEAFLREERQCGQDAESGKGAGMAPHTEGERGSSERVAGSR